MNSTNIDTSTLFGCDVGMTSCSDLQKLVDFLAII